MKFRIIVLILPLFLVGCQLISRDQNNKGLLNWNYGDLRLLDPIDTTEPDQDLIAIYTRINNQSFQIRLDFLDLSVNLGKDIYIPLDTNPGGTTQIKTKANEIIASDINWNYIIIIPDSGKIEILDDHLSPISGVELFIAYDSAQDRMVISFNKNALPLYYGRTKLQVIITPANQNIISDKSESFFIDSPSPPRAKVIFAFWNTFSSITPAQTLRSWAGAHMGPMSSRHGLSYLIDAAEQTNSTIYLLDFLTPDTLSALDYLNALPRIRKLVNQEVLGLPSFGNIMEVSGTNAISISTQPENPIYSLDIYKIWQIRNNLNDSNYKENKSEFLLLLNNYISIDNKFLNYGDYDYAQYNNIKTCGLLPYNKANSEAVNNMSSISVDCKKLLLSYALSHPTTPLILGGDFSKSMLGDPSLSSEVFSYIRAHPWIQILSISDVMNSSEVISSTPLPSLESNTASTAITPQGGLTNKTNLNPLQYKIYEALLQSPNNQLTDLAWQVFSNLTLPATPELVELRSNYIGQIGFILAAAEWAKNPSSQRTCNIDLDYDGFSECILANDTIFAIIEPEGGYIPFVFAKDAQGIHQIIGPTWEFVVGLSDASSWNLELGVRGDSAQLLGALPDPFDNWNRYDINLIDNKIEMVTDSMSIRKIITILPNSLHIDILNSGQLDDTSIIPLVIDPWFRYTSGWGDLYVHSSMPFSFRWGIISGEMVNVRATNPIDTFSFNDSRTALAFPEDPNYDYSRGHYLPYPMSVTEIHATETYSVDIIVNP